MGAVWKNTCTKKNGLFTCSSKLAMPVSKATSPLTIRCVASLGEADFSQVSTMDYPSSPAGESTSAAYLDWVEHEAKVVNPTRPILGVPLTSAAINFIKTTGNTNLSWFLLIVFVRKMFIFSDDLFINIIL